MGSGRFTPRAIGLSGDQQRIERIDYKVHTGYPLLHVRAEDIDRITGSSGGGHKQVILNDVYDQCYWIMEEFEDDLTAHDEPRFALPIQPGSQ